MLSGSRRCLSIKTQSRKVSKQQLNEPLLFLYPRWFRIAAATYQQSHKTSTIPPRHVWLDLSHPAASNASSYNNVSTTPSRRVWTNLSQSASNDNSSATGKRVETAHFPQDEKTDLHKGPQTKLAATKDPWRLSANPLKSRYSMFTNSQVNKTTTTALSSIPAGTDLSIMRQTDGIRHYEPKLKIRRTRQSAYRQVLAKGPEPTTRTIKKEAIKRLHNPTDIEWSEPIRLLARLTHRPKELLGERLELHRETVYRLTGSLGANAWLHQVGRGCEVQILEECTKDRDKLVVILHGTAQARGLTREHLLEADRDLANSAPWQLSPKDNSAEVRFVLSSLKWHYRTTDVRRANMVEHPQGWNVRSFADVVETLTTMRIPRQLQRELYEGTETHNRTVAQVLESLFSDPRSEPFISTRALNYALQFTGKHTEISDTSTFLFEKARSIGLSIQVDTFNILIEESLRQNNLEYYRSLVASMQRMEVVPNGMTWVALLRVTKSHAGRRAILQHIRTRWQRDPEIWKQVAIELVSTDFARLVRLEKSFDYFVDLMDHTFPSSWLSARCINRMLNVCAEKKLWDVVPRILDLAERRGGHFNSSTQTSLLKIFQKRGSLRDSIDLLESHFAKTIGRDSAFAIPMVFMTAWNNRFYNVCRVLWRYASVHGNITSTMQHVVALSLIKNNDESNDSASHLWRITAGKIIVGTDLDMSDLAPQYKHLNREGLTDPMKILARWTPDDGPRQEQLSLAYTVMQRDLTAYKRFWPFRPQQLFDLLRRAYKIDCGWMHEKKVRKYSDLEWMMESAIHVPLQRLADPSVSPRHLLGPVYANGEGRKGLIRKLRIGWDNQAINMRNSS
jgi:hypothetical protein